MNSSIFLSITTFIYGLAAFFYIFSVVFKKPFFGKLGTWTFFAGILGNAGGILLRWLESYQFGVGHAPLSNKYESLVFFAFVIGVVYLVVEKTYKNRSIGAFISPLAFLSMAYASLSPDISDRIQPLLPALKSNWLIAHVVTCFIGYAAFAIAFGLGIMFLLKQNESELGTPFVKFFPDLSLIDELSHQMIMFGFLFLSAGIITGAVWANSAWGRYWGWDPKETWSLITWFIYATLLHARFVKGWRGKRLAYLSIIGFMAVLFTYFGVNYLPGLHSYGR